MVNLVAQSIKVTCFAMFFQFGCFISKVEGQERASLLLQIVLDGDIPAVHTMLVDPLFSKRRIVIPELVVDRETLGIANAILMPTASTETILEETSGTTLPKEKVLTLKDGRFGERIVGCRFGDTLSLSNDGLETEEIVVSDTSQQVRNRLRASPQKIVSIVQKVDEFLLTLEPFDGRGFHCSVYANRSGIHAISDVKGRIHLADLPIGVELEFIVFHDRCRVQRVKEFAQDNGRGPVEIIRTTLIPGLNDLGVFYVSKDEFLP